MLTLGRPSVTIGESEVRRGSNATDNGPLGSELHGLSWGSDSHGTGRPSGVFGLRWRYLRNPLQPTIGHDLVWRGLGPH